MNVSNLRLKEIMDDTGNIFSYKSIMEQGKGRNSYYTSCFYMNFYGTWKRCHLKGITGKKELGHLIKVPQLSQHGISKIKYVLIICQS